MARAPKKALNTAVMQKDFTSTTSSSSSSSIDDLDQTPFGIEEEDYAAIDAAHDTMSSKNVSTPVTKENTTMTTTTTPAAASTNVANENQLTKADKAANAHADRGEGRFSYSECMSLVISDKSRAAIEAIQRHIKHVWLKKAQLAVTGMAPETPWMTSEHKANRQRIKQLFNMTIQMLQNCDQVLLPRDEYPMPLSQFIAEMKDNDVLNTPLLTENLSFYDRYMLMNGDQEDRAYCGLEWLSGKLPQYATVEPASIGWKLLINGNAYNISVKELYKLAADAIPESAQVASYTRECVFGTNGPNGNEDGHTMVVHHAVFTTTSGEIIDLGTIRLSMAHRYWLAVVASMGWYMTEDPNLEALGYVVTYVFGDDHTLPSNLVNFTRFWFAYNLLAKCKDGTYILKTEEEFLEALGAGKLLDRNHVNSPLTLKSEPAMYEAMALTAQDEYDAILAKAAEKEATAKVAIKPDVRKVIVTQNVSERPFGNNKAKMDAIG
jgi:hypothetical protein